ncbi:hypothetical protein [Paenibacillus methanolicus]|uniref:Uncharacterized protein n=1 Tax=Paenibacillus methanolicus TaxID=582686 RepID=A0A5S5BN68_9BACL|nr:hypothetical protein [Paenibacillus methanolicus]TYP67706.1 hypothetical protein BCM02_12331 [Paenibacillus methanolicus]
MIIDGYNVYSDDGAVLIETLPAILHGGGSYRADRFPFKVSISAQTELSSLTFENPLTGEIVAKVSPSDGIASLQLIFDAAGSQTVRVGEATASRLNEVTITVVADTVAVEQDRFQQLNARLADVELALAELFGVGGGE